MVTLKQLAKELNVSISTVSKALNDSNEIGKHTTTRVKELAKYYNYKPNKVALSLKSNTTKTIGVIIPNILNRFFAKALFGIEKEATIQGYNIITCMSNETYVKEKGSLQLLSNGSVDGFILAVAEETQAKGEFNHFESILREGMPIVMFDRVSKLVNGDKVIIDDFEASRKATANLVKKGRKYIAFITSIDDLSVGKLREAGFVKANSKGLDSHDDQKILRIGKNDDSQEQIRQFYKDNPDIDGIVSADNISGTIAINTAISLGLKVPKDISIIGFADQIISNLSTPKLTTINQNPEEIGKHAVQLLIRRLQSKDEILEPITKVVGTSIIESESS